MAESKLGLVLLGVFTSLVFACGSDDGTGGGSADANADVIDADPAAPDADPTAPDASMVSNPDAAVANNPDANTGPLCAEPGATGNSMGVGKYCQVDGDCSGEAASLCTVAQQADAPPFCTKVCLGFGDECGENASCDGDGVLMGCVPNCILD